MYRSKAHYIERFLDKHYGDDSSNQNIEYEQENSSLSLSNNSLTSSSLSSSPSYSSSSETEVGSIPIIRNASELIIDTIIESVVKQIINVKKEKEKQEINQDQKINQNQNQKINCVYSDQYNFLIPKLDNDNIHLTVVFDLDETILYNRDWFAVRNYVNQSFEKLRKMKNLEIILWTASSTETCHQALEKVFSSYEEYFDHIICRNDRWFKGNDYEKDLRLLGRDMNKIVIIENNPHACHMNPENTLLVKDFYGCCLSYDFTFHRILDSITYCHQQIKNFNKSIQNAISTLHTIYTSKSYGQHRRHNKYIPMALPIVVKIKNQKDILFMRINDV